MDLRPRYSCSLAGNCEVDNDNGYLTSVQCNDSCHPTVLPLDVVYNILDYMQEEALLLAPSDRVEAVHQVTGVVVPSEDASVILRALIDIDIQVIARYPVLYRWAEENIYPQDWAFILQETATLPAIRELERLGYPITSDTIEMFIDRAPRRDVEAYLGRLF